MPRKAIGDHVMSPKERQARRREQFSRMKDALCVISTTAKTITEARDIAREALSAPPRSKETK